MFNFSVVKSLRTKLILASVVVEIVMLTLLVTVRAIRIKRARRARAEGRAA